VHGAAAALLAVVGHVVWACEEVFAARAQVDLLAGRVEREVGDGAFFAVVDAADDGDHVDGELESGVGHPITPVSLESLSMPAVTVMLVSTPDTWLPPSMTPIGAAVSEVLRALAVVRAVNVAAFV